MTERVELAERNGCHDNCEASISRASAAGKRVIQTRVDRERDGGVKSRLVLMEFIRDRGRTQPEMFALAP